MAFHLEGPWLTTIGKKKGKKKFRNSEAAQRARQLDESWKELKQKWGQEEENKKRQRALSAKPLQSYRLSYRGSNDPKVPSLNGGIDKGIAAKPDAKVYTGTNMIGIGTLHKSNAVPIFSSDDAVAISQMRR